MRISETVCNLLSSMVYNPPHGVLVHKIDRVTRVPRTQREKMAMGAVRLFRVYLVGKPSFLFRQLGRGKKLRDRCNLLDLLCRTRLLKKAIYFLPLFLIHLLFSSIIPPISFDILRREFLSPSRT